MKRFGSKLRMESLEGRELMAGDVSVGEINGDLVIEGDSGNSTIEVYQLDNDSYRVRAIGSGLNGAYPPWWNSGGAVETTINGITDDIVIDMGSGDDKVYLGRSTGMVTTANDIWVNLEGGNDMVQVNRVNAGDDLRLNGGTGSDSGYVYSSSTGGDTTHADLVFDDFDQTIRVVDTNVGNDLRIDSSHTGYWQGMSIRIDNVNVVDDFWLSTGDGRDSITLEDTHVGDDTELFTGDEPWWTFGGDRIWLIDSSSGDRLHVEAGQGDDRLTLDNFDSARGYLYGELGNDDLNMNSQTSFSGTFVNAF